MNPFIAIAAAVQTATPSVTPEPLWLAAGGLFGAFVRAFFVTGREMIDHTGRNPVENLMPLARYVIPCARRRRDRRFQRWCLRASRFTYGRIAVIIIIIADYASESHQCVPARISESRPDSVRRWFVAEKHQRVADVFA